MRLQVYTNTNGMSYESIFLYLSEIMEINLQGYIEVSNYCFLMMLKGQTAFLNKASVYPIVDKTHLA